MLNAMGAAAGLIFTIAGIWELMFTTTHRFGWSFAFIGWGLTIFAAVLHGTPDRPLVDPEQE